MAFFAQRRVGELNSRISADVALLQEGLHHRAGRASCGSSVTITVCITR
jgi:hypothetical protein